MGVTLLIAFNTIFFFFVVMQLKVGVRNALRAEFCSRIVLSELNDLRTDMIQRVIQFCSKKVEFCSKQVEVKKRTATRKLSLRKNM